MEKRSSSYLPVSDPLGELQIFWANLLMTVVPSADIRQKMRLKGISQRLEGELGWYLWREDRPGAYSLEITEAWDELSENGGISGRCRIKYYPAPEGDNAFDGLSSYEKDVRLGSCFDDTGTPVFDSIGHILPEAFLAGYLGIRLTSAFVNLSLCAQDRWQVSWNADGESGNGNRFERNFPGWEQVWPVLDVLVIAWNAFFTCRPLASALYEEEGKIWKWAGHELVPSPSPDRVNRKLLLSLPRSGAQNAPDPYARDPFSHIQNWMEEEKIPDSLSSMCIQPPTEPSAWINPLWWLVDRTPGDVGLCCLNDSHISKGGGP